MVMTSARVTSWNVATCKRPYVGRTLDIPEDTPPAFRVHIKHVLSILWLYILISYTLNHLNYYSIERLAIRYDCRRHLIILACFFLHNLLICILVNVLEHYFNSICFDRGNRIAARPGPRPQQSREIGAHDLFGCLTGSWAR